jgi:hypothetical protein
VVFSLSGSELWTQFGLRVLSNNGNSSILFPIPEKDFEPLKVITTISNTFNNNSRQLSTNVWIDLESARQSVKVSEKWSTC